MTRRSAEWWVAVFFLLSTAAAVGFVVVYVLGLGPQAQGTLLGTACAALAAGFVLWAGQLLPKGTFVEEREPMAPPPPESEALVGTLERGRGGTPPLLRRTLVLALLALTTAAVVPLRSLFPISMTPRGQLGETRWRPGVRLMTREGDLVRAEEVAVGTALTLFPEDAPEADDAVVVVVRIPPTELRLLSPPTAAGAVLGIVAFSKLCTHAGCPVGLYEQTTRQLLCPCHQSVFDVLDRARPVLGPAARPLPQLPLAVDDAGYLVAAGTFDDLVGPTVWWADT